MEEEGERRRRGISAYNKRRRPPTQSSKSSSPSQGTSASLRCCAGGAATRVNNLSFSPEMKQELPIWRRKERGEGEERTGKSLLEGEVRFDLLTSGKHQYEADPQTVHPLPPSPSPTLLSMSRASHRGHPHRSCTLGENHNKLLLFTVIDDTLTAFSFVYSHG